MGKLLSKIFGNKEMRILMLGLDAAGKTSIFFIVIIIVIIIDSLGALINPFRPELATYGFCTV